MRGLPQSDFGAAFGDAPIMVLAPHPDDESLGCGGLIAEACARGCPPVVAILTDGTGSHPNSAAFPPGRLRALREREAAAATAALGLPRDRLLFLRYADTAAPSTGAAVVAAAARLGALLRAFSCTTLVASWRHDPHCDHEAAAAIASIACRDCTIRLLAYPVWGWTLPADLEIDQPAITGFRLDVSRHLGRKRRAILAHASQYAGIIGDDPGGFQLAPDFIDLFLTPTETFIETDPCAMAVA